MRGKALKRIMAGALSLAMIFSVNVLPFSADNAKAATGEIIVKIGSDEPISCSTFDEAMATVRAADDNTEKTITLSEGTFKSTDANTFRIDEPNTNIVGAGQDKTIIDTGDMAISGQAGVLVCADNVKISNLKVTSANPGASGGAIKVTLIGDGINPLQQLKGIEISDVALSTEKGYGLNIHGANGAVISNVNVEKAEKASVSLALVSDTTIDNLTTGESGWKTDIIIQYKDDNVNYYAPTDVKVTNANLKYNYVTSSRPTTATDGTDQFEVDGLVFVENADGSKDAVAPEVAAKFIKNENSGKTYATIQAAINAAQDGETINIPEGEFKENLNIDKELTIVGAGENTVIKFNSATKVAQTYFGTSTAYPIIYATAGLTLENLTVAGPTDQHHGIDGILAKADFTMNNVTVKDIRCTADGGFVCGVQYGKAVIVDGDVDVTIEKSTIKDFQKQAIDIKTSGKALIKNNTITGVGDQGIITQNGIVLRGGTEATIQGNVISNLRYTADNEWSDGSYAVYAMNNVDMTMNENTIEGVDNGIMLDNNVNARINNNIINSDHYGLVSYSTGNVDAANNYWAGPVDEKTYVEKGSIVTGLDDVKTEPVIDQPSTDEPSIDKPATGDNDQATGDKTDADKVADSDSPKTGDDTMVLGYVIMMLAALGIGGTLVVNRKKN